MLLVFVGPSGVSWVVGDGDLPRFRTDGGLLWQPLRIYLDREAYERSAVSQHRMSSWNEAPAK